MSVQELEKEINEIEEHLKDLREKIMKEEIEEVVIPENARVHGLGCASSTVGQNKLHL